MNHTYYITIYLCVRIQHGSTNTYGWSRRRFNSLKPRQNGRHFADDTFNRIFVNENVRISIKFSLKFVPKGPINNIPALVQIMAWRRPGAKPLSESVMVSLLTHICVTRPQWVNMHILQGHIWISIVDPQEFTDWVPIDIMISLVWEHSHEDYLRILHRFWRVKWAIVLHSYYDERYCYYGICKLIAQCLKERHTTVHFALEFGTGDWGFGLKLCQSIRLHCKNGPWSHDIEYSRVVF